MSAPSPRRRPPLAWLAGLALLAFSFAYAGWVLRTQAGSGPPADSPGTPTPEKVAYGIGHVDVEGGVVFPAPLAPGTVAAVLVKEGQAVKAGDALFRMDDTLAKADLRAAEEAVKVARAQVDEARAAVAAVRKKADAVAAARDAAEKDIEVAKFAVEKARSLAQIQAIGVREQDVKMAEAKVIQAELAWKAKGQELEAVRSEEATYQAKVEQAGAGVTAKEALVAKARYALDETVVKAREAGTVLRLSLHAGDRLTAEVKLPPLVFCPAKARVVRLEIPQEWAGRAAVGQVATIEDDTSNGDGPKWKGKVARVADWMAHRRSILPDPGQFHDIRTLEAVIALDPGQPPLRIGQRVRVTLRHS